MTDNTTPNDEIDTEDAPEVPEEELLPVELDLAPEEDDIDGVDTDTTPVELYTYEQLVSDETAVFAIGSNPDHLNRKLGEVATDLGEAGFRDALARPDHYARNVFRSTVEFNNDENERMHDAISAVKDRSQYGPTFTGQVGANKVDFRILRPRRGTSDAPVVARGRAGLTNVLRSLNFDDKGTGGINRRCPLYNSGIWVDMYAPGNADIHEMFTTADLEVKEYGRTQGYWFFHYADLLLKRPLWNMITRCIASTNYALWADRREEKSLASVVSIHDFSVLLWYLASLRYPDGYPIKHVCENPNCQHTTEVKADLTKGLNTNFAGMPDDAKTRLWGVVKGSAVDATFIHDYRKDLGFDGRTITHGNVTLTLKVPSVQDYFKQGEAFNGELLTTYADRDSKEQLSATSHRFNRILGAWVAKITTPDVIIEDDWMVKNKALDQIQTHDTENVVSKAIMDFINETQLTHHGYPAFECPACGHIPETKSGFITVDPQSTFFTFMRRLLLQSTS